MDKNRSFLIGCTFIDSVDLSGRFFFILRASSGRFRHVISSSTSARDQIESMLWRS